MWNAITGSFGIKLPSLRPASVSLHRLLPFLCLLGTSVRSEGDKVLSVPPRSLETWVHIVTRPRVCGWWRIVVGKVKCIGAVHALFRLDELISRLYAIGIRPTVRSAQGHVTLWFR
jgi:hypothetical protein